MTEIAQINPNSENKETMVEENKNIYSYTSEFKTYAIGCSWLKINGLKYAIGSFKNEVENQVI